MADNVGIRDRDGVNVDVSAEDLGSGVKVQRVRIQHGPARAPADVSSASPLPVGDGGGSLTVDGTITVSSSALPTGAATETTLASVAGSVDGVEALLTTIDADTSALGTTADTAAGVGSSGTISAKLRTLTTSADAIARGGNVAHDGVDSGNPVKIGGRARTALPAAVAQDDRADAVLDKYGRRLALVAPLDQRRSGTTNYTGTSAADVIAAPGASTAIVVTRILVTNASASVGTKVTIRDGTTAKVVGYAAAGGGFTLADEGGLFVASSNTAVTAICGTTGADVDVTVFGYAIPV